MDPPPPQVPRTPCTMADGKAVRRLGQSLVIAIVFLSCAAVPVRASEPRDLLDSYSLATWSDKDGLPTGPIRALVQDAEGYLWLGSDSGLVRFDGVRFVPWDELNEAPLPSASVSTLRATRDGSLWVAFGDSGGVSRISHGRVQNYGERDGLPTVQVVAIVEDAAGTVWACSNRGLYRFSHGRWEQLGSGRGLPKGPIYAGYVNREGSLFVATATGVFKRHLSPERFDRIASTEDPVFSISEDSQGRIYVTDPATGFKILNERQPQARSLSRGQGAQLLHDRRDSLWVATVGQGVWRVRLDTDPQAPKMASVSRGRSDEDASLGEVVRALLEDRDGNVWVGSRGGLSRFTPRRVTQRLDLGLVNGVEETRDGSVWIQAPDALVQLTEVRGEWRTERRYLEGFRPRAMHVDEHGTLWVASDRGVVRFTGRTSAREKEAVSDGLHQVDSITSDGSGGVWLHDVEQGLLRWNSGRLEPFALPEALRRTSIVLSTFRQSRVVSTFTDRGGRVWIGFVRGALGRLDRDGRFQVFGPQDGVTAGAYSAMFQDSAGVMWFGGSNGLTRHANGRFVTFDGKQGFPAKLLTAIIEDETGALWLGTASGLVRIDRGEFDHAIVDRGYQIRYRLFDGVDGVTGTPKQSGSRGAIRTNDGRLWFLTGLGLTIVDPETLQHGSAPPGIPVWIEAIIADQRKLAVTPGVALPPSIKRLEIDWSALNLTFPLRTTFRYRLEGLDADWIDTGKRRQAIYTNLRPGNYRFRVQANNGAWLEPGVAFAFSVPVMFYQTIWFWTGCATSLCVAVGVAWRLRLRRVRRQFALVLGERFRVSREIHDTLLQSLVGLTLQLDHLRKEPKLTPQMTREQLLQMRKQTETYIREARQSIWNLRSLTPQRCDLATALRQAWERVAEKDVAFDIRVMGTPRPCGLAVEEQVLRIGQEAVTNAIRHSQAHRIAMELHYQEAALTLRISDDGCGFAPTSVNSDSNGHCGVMGMKERAETIGATFRISSVIGAGTVVETTVPTSASA